MLTSALMEAQPLPLAKFQLHSHTYGPFVLPSFDCDKLLCT